MISMSQALGWLNQLDQSHLSQKSVFTLWQISQTNLTEFEKEKLIDAAIYNTRDSADPIEYAEVLVNCGKIQVDRNRLPQGHIYLDYARTVYEKRQDRFRLAVVLWMMSIIERKLLENHASHGHARTARGLLEQIKREPTLDQKNNYAWWLQDRISEMDEDLVATPEEAYFWLNQFESTHLKPTSIQFCDSIVAGVREKQFGRVYHLVASLIDITRSSTDPFETSEILAFCGLVNIQMGNSNDAIKLLRKSIVGYDSKLHHQTAVRWMLGMTLFTQPTGISQAVSNCNLCISDMEKLKSNAEQRNRPHELSWYENKVVMMRKILNKKIRSFEDAVRP